MGNAVSDLCCQLRSAAQAGKRDECLQLIKLGAAIDCQDNLGSSTALHEACRYGHPEIAALLLKHGARHDSRDCIGHTPIFYAAKGGHDSIVEMLIKHGASVTAVSNKGRTALHCAVQQGHRVTALTLIEHGAGVFARDQEGNTPCQLAAKSGSMQALMVIHGALEGLEGDDAQKAAELVNIKDEAMPSHARLILYHWIDSFQRGKDILVPPREMVQAKDCHALAAFFAPPSKNLPGNKRARQPSLHSAHNVAPAPKRLELDEGSKSEGESTASQVTPDADSTLALSDVAPMRRRRPSFLRRRLPQYAEDDDSDEGSDTEAEAERADNDGDGDGFRQQLLRGGANASRGLGELEQAVVGAAALGAAVQAAQEAVTRAATMAREGAASTWSERAPMGSLQSRACVESSS